MESRTGYYIVLDHPDTMTEYEAQQTFLEGFPERIGQVKVAFVLQSHGLVDPDDVPAGPRVPPKGKALQAWLTR